MDASFREAYNYSCKLLKLKDRSEYEIIQRLKDKGFDEDTILRVVEKLKNNLFIDDKKFALSYIERNLNKLKSIKMIVNELKEKYKISEEILENIDFMSYKNKQREIIKNLLDKKFKNFDREKLYRYLLTRGFEEVEIEFLISSLKK